MLANNIKVFFLKDLIKNIYHTTNFLEPNQITSIAVQLHGFGPWPVQLGAEFVHGGGNNCVVEMSRNS